MNQKIFIEFIQDLENHHNEETCFNAICGDFEKYIQKKLAFFLNKANIQKVCIEKYYSNVKYKLDLEYEYKNKLFGAELKSIHFQYSNTIRSSIGTGISQLIKLTKAGLGHKPILVLSITQFYPPWTNSLLKPQFGLFYKATSKFSTAPLSWKDITLLVNRQLNSTNLKIKRFGVFHGRSRYKKNIEIGFYLLE